MRMLGSIKGLIVQAKGLKGKPLPSTALASVLGLAVCGCISWPCVQCWPWLARSCFALRVT
jgi:hypothetical protein